MVGGRREEKRKERKAQMEVHQQRKKTGEGEQVSQVEWVK